MATQKLVSSPSLVEDDEAPGGETRADTNRSAGLGLSYKMTAAT